MATVRVKGLISAQDQTSHVPKICHWFVMSVIMMSVCPASNGQQAIAVVGRRQA